MANSIAGASLYLKVLDEIYQKASLTRNLDNMEMVKFSENCKEVKMPKITVQGLANYNRDTGYVAGSTTFEYATYTIGQDRGRKFGVDIIDDMDSMNSAFMFTANQFIRTKEIPEIDAYRMAKLASKAVLTAEAILSKTTIAQAIGTAKAAMSEAEVDEEGRILYITPTMANLLSQSDMYVRNVAVTGVNGVINTINSYDGMQVIVIPQSRFYTAITLYDGTTGGQEEGGYIKSVAGKNINFMIVHPSAAKGVIKRTDPKFIAAAVNQTRDSNDFCYRLVHDLFVPDNKVNGIYLHNQAT